MALRVFLVWNRRCKKYGGLTNIKRMKVRYNHTFMGRCLIIVEEKNAEKILAKYCRKILMRIEVNSKIYNFFHKMKKIQRNLRKQTQVQTARIVVLNKYWNLMLRKL